MKRGSKETGLAIEAGVARGAALRRHGCATCLLFADGRNGARSDLGLRAERIAGAGHLEAAGGHAGSSGNWRNHHGQPHVFHRRVPLCPVAHGPDAHTGGFSARLCRHQGGPGEKRAAGHGREANGAFRLAGSGQSGLCCAGVDRPRAVLAARLPLDSASCLRAGAVFCPGAGCAG